MSAIERAKSESEVSMRDAGDEEDTDDVDEEEAEYTEDEMDLDSEEEEEERNLTEDLVGEPIEDDDDDGDFHG